MDIRKRRGSADITFTSDLRAFLRQRRGAIVAYVVFCYVLFGIALLSGATHTMPAVFGGLLVATAPASAVYLLVGAIAPAIVDVPGVLAVAAMIVAVIAILALPAANVLVVCALFRVVRRWRDRHDVSSRASRASSDSVPTVGSAVESGSVIARTSTPGTPSFRSHWSHTTRPIVESCLFGAVFWIPIIHRGSRVASMTLAQ